MLVLRVFMRAGKVESAIGFKRDLDFLFNGYRVLKEIKSQDVNLLLEKASLLKVVPRIVRTQAEMRE